MDQGLNKDGYVKVKLTYVSNHPHTETALTLRKLAIQGPYIEEVRVLLPVEEAYSNLDAYLPALERLKQNRVVPSDSALTDYEFEENENSILAYVVPVFRRAS